MKKLLLLLMVFVFFGVSGFAQGRPEGLFSIYGTYMVPTVDADNPIAGLRAELDFGKGWTARTGGSFSCKSFEESNENATPKRYAMKMNREIVSLGISREIVSYEIITGYIGVDCRYSRILEHPQSSNDKINKIICNQVDARPILGVRCVLSRHLVIGLEWGIDLVSLADSKDGNYTYAEYSGLFESGQPRYKLYRSTINKELRSFDFSGSYSAFDFKIGYRF